MATDEGIEILVALSAPSWSRDRTFIPDKRQLTAMNVRRHHAVAGALVAVSALASVLAAPEMPVQMVTKWNATGEVASQMPKFYALALLPALSVGLLGVFAVLPRLDPLGENVARFREQYDTFVVLVIALLTYVHLLVLAANAGYEFEMIQAVSPGVGALLYYAGVLSEHAEQNWFVGIRTPWTLSDEEVWRRTHQRTAPLLKLAGVVAVLSALVPRYAELLIAVPVAAVTLYATVYSYLAYRRVGA
jgi:uncharacterized membrane protein